MKTIKHIALALSVAAALTLTGCAAEAPPAETKPSASQPAAAAAEEPTATPTPVVPVAPVIQKFGTPDSTFMETITEAGVMLPGIPAREVLDRADFENWVTIDGVEIWNADTCGDVTLIHSEGEVALTCEGGRFFLKD